MFPFGIPGCRSFTELSKKVLGTGHWHHVLTWDAPKPSTFGAPHSKASLWAWRGPHRSRHPHVAVPTHLAVPTQAEAAWGSRGLARGTTAMWEAQGSGGSSWGWGPSEGTLSLRSEESAAFTASLP